jgi:hypothetical protein
MLSLNSLILIAFFSINIIHSLKSDDVCYKRFQCDGINCLLSNCTGLLNFNCDRYECSLDSTKCMEFKFLKNNHEKRKNVILDREFTIGLISFASRRLKKYEKFKQQIIFCS